MHRVRATTTDLEQALARWLDRLTLRSVLSAEEQQALLSLPGELVAIAPNRDFVRLGERVDRSCLIVSGLAGRFGQTRNGERLITALHLPGDMADLHSVMLPDAANALNALTETVIYRVPHDDFHALGRRFPMLAEAFWRDCMVDAAILSEWALRNGRLPAKARIAHLICELSCRAAVSGSRDGAFDWRLSQIQLADVTGLTSVHANRMLRALREEGAAQIKDRRVEILDWKRLRAIGEFNDQYLQLYTAPEQS
ncbi:MAG: Crp/Fnr family transcriptional regulator [Sphingomonas bacterium]|uniref:Crp/Fnr family transcriptional regulator n=1 Tax=Sphingomonas bacterium TaxID=1895847 RepID=UPI00260AFC1F|nr:Crp/Fnr family transcriptional regulator [Sphingomonas bacterium]MDB5711763.1 Crp/Fnr family transcriptional regulator [Sphingomonas bacterium]